MNERLEGLKLEGCPRGMAQGLAGSLLTTRYAASPRIRRMEAHARQRYAAAPESGKRDTMARAFFELYAHCELRERQARTYAYALVNEPVIVNPEDRIHGMVYCKGNAGDPFCDSNLTSGWGEYNAQSSARRRIEAEVPELRAYIAAAEGGKTRTFIINAEGTPGHIAWRWDFVLRDGLEAIIRRHREAGRNTADAEARAYYQGVVICLDAILEWNRRQRPG